jgi:hypothetical protein
LFRSIPLALALSIPLSSGQIVSMGLDQAAGMADQVMIVEVQYAIEFPMDYMSRIEYSLKVLEVVYGVDVQEGDYLAFYSFNLPRSYTGPDGMTTWESPLVTGSGLELTVEEGDTVIALTYTLPCDESAPAEVVRLEPLQNLEAVLDCMDIPQ